LTIDIENLPKNFSEILIKEQEVIEKWKTEGILDHLFLRETKNGAVLIFKGIEEREVKNLIESLPFYALRKNIEYYNLIKKF
jgi:muconolactone D-isomerase